MEIYRHDNKEKFCAVIFMHNKTGKLGLVHNNGDEASIRTQWSHNEKDYRIVEVKPITNVAAMNFFIYWNKTPKAYNNSEHRRMKFDFFKYICGADLSDKYRDVENIKEVKEN